MSDLPEKEPEAAEVLAYQLMLHVLADSPSWDTDNNPVAQWKDEGPDGLSFRKRYRKKAQEFLNELDRCGLRVAKSSSVKVTKRLLEMQEIPARSAYTLDEIKPPSDAPQLPG